ncbi:unnamed protein product [Blumeria hordei]|uniref:Rab-GAP TBC domain-containing protein n=1 Tax=Blumeria hordei TaxID=2867405 RepID=A0A383UIS9_BLUHO|nr:unnamed protein product [Blumeria hordei]
MPSSPPPLSSSKSSKSASFPSSYSSDDLSTIKYVGNFEDIALDDESPTDNEFREHSIKIASDHNSSFQSHVRIITRDSFLSTKKTGRRRTSRESKSGKKSSPHLSPANAFVIGSKESGSSFFPLHTGKSYVANPGPTDFPFRRNRSVSPSIPLSQKLPSNLAHHPRRFTWQVNKERKTAEELERECDENDESDVPDECFLENVPISPQLLSRQNISIKILSTSPEQRNKGKVKPLGNGTSPQPAEQGELRSPRLGVSRGLNLLPPTNLDNFKLRTKSWSAAMSDLNQEAKQLTEALAEHQREVGSQDHLPKKIEAKPTLAELPPLRKTDIMIDPLPISREKEAVLSRTRPSWLPPKDPAEEKRHLKEYQKMMNCSLEADRRKEALRQEKLACRDANAKSLSRTWEHHVLPNWETAIRQKHTRELWWKGISPRSRGSVWMKAIGNDLKLSDTSFTAALRRAEALLKAIESGERLTPEEEEKKLGLDMIEIDVKNTFRELKIFQSNGPLHKSLLEILRAYIMYRSDVGYVYGTSASAALLLLNLPTPLDAFITLSNLLNRPLSLSFHMSDTVATKRACTLLFSILMQKAPRLYSHLTSPTVKFTPEFVFRGLFTSLGTAYLSVDNAARLWDIMVFEGDSIILRATAAYLINIEAQLFSVDTTEQILELFMRNPLVIDEDKWLNSLKSVSKA